MSLFFLYTIIGCNTDTPSTQKETNRKIDPVASKTKKNLPPTKEGFVTTYMEIKLENNSKTDDEIRKEEKKGEQSEASKEPEEPIDIIEDPKDDGALEADEENREIFSYAVEIQTTEVTQKQFTDAMGWNPSFFGGCGLKCMQNSTTSINSIEDVIQEENGDILNAECFDVSTLTEQECGPTCPVESVSWYDAIAYTNVISKQESHTPCFTMTDIICSDGTNVGSSAQKCMNNTQKGILSATVKKQTENHIFFCTGYRLLTQKEWLQATLGREKGPLYTSTNNDGTLQKRGCDLDSNLDQIAWYGANSQGTTHPVAQKEPNKLGLYDMMGNIGEWVYDDVDRPDLNDEFVDEETDINSLNEEGKKNRLREKELFSTKDRQQLGGSWLEYGAYCQADNHTSMPPSDRDASSGFRIIRTIIAP